MALIGRKHRPSALRRHGPSSAVRWPQFSIQGERSLSSVLIELQITAGNERLKRSASHDSIVNTATNEVTSGADAAQPAGRRRDAADRAARPSLEDLSRAAAAEAPVRRGQARGLTAEECAVVLANCLRPRRTGRGLKRDDTAERRGLVDAAIIHGCRGPSDGSWVDPQCGLTAKRPRAGSKLRPPRGKERSCRIRAVL